MRYNSRIDIIKEWAKANKTTLVSAATVALIAVLVSAIMIHNIAPSKAAFTTEVERLDTRITTVRSTVSSLDTKVVANQQALDDVTGLLDDATGNMTALRTRLNLAQDQILSLTAELEKLDALTSSTPAAWLTGIFGNYTVHAKASQAGNFTAIIHLAYASPVVASNSTYQDALEAFYGSIAWNATSMKAYVPTLSYNGTNWGVTAISFNIGTFALEAKVEKTIPVVYGGLPEVYKPDWAYVEIWPAVKEG